ncbi:hypothetical protein HBI25_217230 [Parastagonospora nodorum]|nr:hypothetical protein HBH45_218850 [Parastagonospora nodorum]KAH4483485.1 hypothetical protein HBH89_232270 [Parastagonospora nodorum]KAH5546291.1 hypothetical protein HBI25_217230 [Parastagonospora nodorum]
MPFQVVSIIYKARNMSFEQFKQHYETKHVPLVQSLTDLSSAPLFYTRKYVQRAKDDAAGAASPDFDAITELAFTDEESYKRWASKIMSGTGGTAIAEDMATFTDQARCRMCTVDVIA